jgi:hypothetical protein
LNALGRDVHIVVTPKPDDHERASLTVTDAERIARTAASPRR